MSADANSAFGDAMGGQRPSAHHDNDQHNDARGDNQGRLHHATAPSVSRSSRSVRGFDSTQNLSDLSSAGHTQTASIAADSNWFEQPGHTSSALEDLLQRLQAQINRTFSDQVTPVRLASHISVLLVAATILILSNIDIPEWRFSLRLFPNSALLGTSNSDGLSPQMIASLNQNSAGTMSTEALQRAAVPFTAVHVEPTPEKLTVEQYVVQSGDTVLGIAENFGLNPETIQWANPTLEMNADLISPGDSLNILPVDGALHTITSGDTLSSIADTYEVDVEDVINYGPNGLEGSDAPLTLGTKLVIPGGTKTVNREQVIEYASSNSVPTTAQLGTGNFIWPAEGSINQRYWSGHPGIDVGAWTGAPVRAADGGYVAVATGGWNGGYGNHVIVDHGNGFVTLYAHLNSIYVKPGENVSRNQQVGSVGNTGNSTGPHLHFEIRYQGSQRNPLGILP